MRRSEFDRAVADEFGARGGSLMTDLVLTSVGGRTSADALAAGVDPRDVWLALCEETDVSTRSVVSTRGAGDRAPGLTSRVPDGARPRR
ncbi:MAG: DUF3046 domain-containing protein [Microbacterium sp.]|uniref:DUF3046 domain-containing protein n=1 Tax=Microbacterium sp. TaxID=51671 RepID=UPI003459A1F3|nr:DUF3046 domain-containing protein [Microbacterium sp.]